MKQIKKADDTLLDDIGFFREYFLPQNVLPQQLHLPISFRTNRFVKIFYWNANE